MEGVGVREIVLEQGKHDLHWVQEGFIIAAGSSREVEMSHGCQKGDSN